MKKAKGSLLVSGALLKDQNFHRTVIFVVEHDQVVSRDERVPCKQACHHLRVTST